MIKILNGHCLEVLRSLPEESVHTVVTSPPYWGLRDYGLPAVTWGDGWVGQLGLEPTPEQYVGHLVEVFQEVWRVLHRTGTVWLNLGDCYATGAGRVGDQPGGGEQGARWRGEISRERDGLRRTRQLRDGTHAGKHTAMAAMGPMTQPNRMPIAGLKPKDLVGVPWRVAFALQADGWWLRNDNIWAKKNCMPESVTDRCTKAHEYVFLLTRSEDYYYDAVAIEEEQDEHERTRRLKEQERGLDSVYDLRREEAHGQVAPGQSGAAKSARARQDLALKGTRNKRTVWFIGTTPFTDAHFATMPPELAETGIKAGSSARGHCPQCGVGWDRIVKKAPAAGKASGNIERKLRQDHGGLAGDARNQAHAVPYEAQASVTLGWYPGCDCAGDHPDLPPYPPKPKDDKGRPAWLEACSAIDEARAKLCAALAHLPTVRGVALDPFGGAGTTGLVADRLQRDAVLIELNPKYADMGERRITADGPLFADVQAVKAS